MKKRTNPQSGSGHIILIVLMALAVAAAGFFVIKRVSTARNNKGANEWAAGCKSNERITMTHMPMDMADVSSVTPVGLTAGAHVTPIDHLYFYPQAGPRDKYPVYAMADGAIIQVQVRGVNVDSGENRPPEYRIVVQHSCQTISYFDLVTKLDPAIATKVGKLSSNGWTGRIPVKSGQEIGRIGAQSLDTAVYNLSLTLPGFIHPEMYKGEAWKVHTDQFFTYFNDPLKSQMLAKNPRTVEPRSGKIDYDLPGKLRGNWFKQGTGGYSGRQDQQVGDGSGRGYWSGHLAFFYNAIKPDQINVSIGDFQNGQPEAFAVVGNAPDPATISSTNGITKYNLVRVEQGGQVSQEVRGVILVQVLADEKLKVEVVPGKTAAQVSSFSSAAVTYER